MEIPVRNMPLWKVLIVMLSYCIILGVFSLMPIFISNGSIIAIIVAVSHPLMGAIAVLLSARTKIVWARFLGGHSWMFIIYATGLFALNAAYPIPMGWLLVFLVMYALAWLLPYLRPALSSIILREQMAPETKLGKGCMSIALGGLPTIGSIAAVIGLHASRSGEENVVYLIMGIIGILTALAGSQAFSHQIWEQTRKTKSSDQEAEV